MINLSRKPCSTKLILLSLLLALTVFVIYHLFESTQLPFTTMGIYRHMLGLGGTPLEGHPRKVSSPLMSDVKKKKVSSLGQQYNL